jgi:hypothetical protein
MTKRKATLAIGRLDAGMAARKSDDRKYSIARLG